MLFEIQGARCYTMKAEEDSCEEGTVHVEPGKVEIRSPGIPRWSSHKTILVTAGLAGIGGLAAAHYGWSKGQLQLAALAVLVGGMLLYYLVVRPFTGLHIVFSADSFRVLTPQESVLMDIGKILATLVPVAADPPAAPEKKEPVSFWPWKNPSEGEKYFRSVEEKLRRLDAMGPAERRRALERLEQLAGPDLDRVNAEVRRLGLEEIQEPAFLAKQLWAPALRALSALRSSWPDLAFVAKKPMKTWEFVRVFLFLRTEADAKRCLDTFNAPTSTLKSP